VTLGFAVTGAGSSNVRTGRACDGLEGTHGASTYFTIVLGASPEFAVTVGCINQKRTKKKAA